MEKYFVTVEVVPSGIRETYGQNLMKQEILEEMQFIPSPKGFLMRLQKRF
jgi:hypothetical protein